MRPLTLDVQLNSSHMSFFTFTYLLTYLLGDFATAV